MEEDEISPEQFAKLSDKEKVEYLTNEMGKSAKLLIEGYHIMSEMTERYDDLCAAAKIALKTGSSQGLKAHMKRFSL